MIPDRRTDGRMLAVPEPVLQMPWIVDGMRAVRLSPFEGWPQSSRMSQGTYTSPMNTFDDDVPALTLAVTFSSTVLVNVRDDPGYSPAFKAENTKAVERSHSF
jgi:hypothetical protein